MSKAVSVLNGADFSGAVTVRDAGLVGMITVRGDLSGEQMAKAVKSAVGLALPKARQIKHGKKGSAAWMSPDELLLLVDYDLVDDVVGRLDATLAGSHHMAVNVSDARAMFTLVGAGLRDVIAKGAPADLSVEGLPVGEIRRTRLGQIAAAFWLSDAETLSIVCFRSYGAHMFAWLCNAAEKNTLPGVL